MRIKPQSADVYLKYKCPKCDAIHLAQREETVFPGGVLCCCGYKLRFAPVKSIKLSLDYGVVAQTLDKAAIAATQVLRGQGFDKAEIDMMMKMSDSKLNPQLRNNVEYRVKACLQQFAEPTS